eukprot:10124201-Lingulodinium_polyedra.AAC.1
MSPGALATPHSSRQSARTSSGHCPWGSGIQGRSSLVQRWAAPAGPCVAQRAQSRQALPDSFACSFSSASAAPLRRSRQARH